MATFERRVVRLFGASERPDQRFVAALMDLWHRTLRIERSDGNRLVIAAFDCDRDGALTEAAEPVSGGPYCSFSITYNTRTEQVTGGPPLVVLECDDEPPPQEVVTPGCWAPDSAWMNQHDAEVRLRLAQSRRISDRVVAALYHRWSRTAVGVCAGDRELASITFTCEGTTPLDPALGYEARSRCHFNVLYDPATGEVTGGPVTEVAECSNMAPSSEASTVHAHGGPPVTEVSGEQGCAQASNGSSPLVLQRDETRLTVVRHTGGELIVEREVPTGGRIAEAHACRTSGEAHDMTVSWVSQQDRRTIRVAGEDGGERRVAFDEPVRAHAWVQNCSAILALIGTPTHGAVVRRSVALGVSDSYTRHVAGRGLRSLRSLGDQRRFAIGDESRLIVLDVVTDEIRWVELGPPLEGSFDVHQCGERLVRVATDWESGDPASHGVHRAFEQSTAPDSAPEVVGGLSSLHIQSVTVEGSVLFAVGWSLVNQRGRPVRRNADGYPLGPPALFAIDLSSSTSAMVGPLATGVLYFDR